MRRKVLINTGLLTALHLVVDGLCACSLLLGAGKERAEAVMLLLFGVYNVTAFGSQPLTGHWIDKAGRQRRGLWLAMLFLVGGAMAALSCEWYPNDYCIFLGAVLLGLGNSLFHVCGGKYVAVIWQNDQRPQGIFVSTGAVGLAVGGCFRSVALLVAFMLVLVGLTGWLLRGQHFTAGAVPAEKHTPTLPSPQATPTPYLLALMLVVAGRSFIGKAIPSLPSEPAALLVLLSMVGMMGKAAGGFASARFGLRPTLLCSLVLAVTGLLLCPLEAHAIPATLFLVNLSMPLTLHLANKAMPGREGLAFGLLAAALLPGFALGAICQYIPESEILVTPLLATLLIEGLLLLYMRERRWQVLTACVWMNVLTNVPLNIFVILTGCSLPVVLELEAAVVLVEFLCYLGVTRNWRTALAYSAICNATSYLAGVLFEHLVY